MGLEQFQGTSVVTVPPHFPTMHTRETVMHLVAFGLDESQIAVILRCTAHDVRTHYKDEIEHGLARVNAQVMGAVLHAALFKDSAVDRKLWLVNRAGWKAGDGNKVAIANVTPNGEPLSPDGQMTVVQRREVITTLITKATRFKREQERVIDGEIVPAKKNGNGANGNGHGSNGNGAGNGSKHR